jgi:IclR family pca regulon transcriptional regulator
MTLSQIAAATQTTRATARRIVLTLEKVGYVAGDGHGFALAPRVLEIGRGYLSSLGVPEIAQPYMLELVRQTRESSSMATLDGLDIIYVARVPTERIMSISLSVGTRLPAYATSMGRVLLSRLAPADLDAYFSRVQLKPLTAKTITSPPALRSLLDVVRQRGWALNDEELEEGVRSVAVPISSRRGKTVAALNVSVNASRVTTEQLLNELLPLLQSTATRISAQVPD